MSLVQCRECALGFLNPRPTPEKIADYYQSAGYQPFLSAKRRKSAWDQLYSLARTAAVRRKRTKIEKVKPTGNLLDVGCGTGEFSHEMQSHDWTVAGVEKDPRAAQFAREKYDLSVTVGDLGDIGEQQAAFDVVTFWHVLEHLFDPVGVLKQVENVLKPDGFALIAAPDFASFDSGFYGSNWVALDAPRHLLHFNPQSMQHLCRAAGLTVLGHYQMVLDAFYNCLMSEMLISARSGANSALQLYRFVRGAAIASASVLLASRLGTKKLGSSVLYIIRKA